MNDAKKSFDERAKEWDTPIKIDRSKKIAQLIIPMLPQGKPLKAMELGCGTGLVSYELKNQFEEIALVDTSDGMLDVLNEKIARENLNHFHPILADVLQKPLGERFDIIYTVMTLHHIPDVKLALTKLYEMLTPGGIFFAADLDKEDGSFHKPWEKVHHGFERIELSAMCSESGFVDVNFSTAYVMKRLGKWFKSKKYSIFLLRAIRPQIS